MPLLKINQLDLGSLRDDFDRRRDMTLEEIEAEFRSCISDGEELRRLVRDIDSGKARISPWDMGISYSEFRARVLAGHYDNDDNEEEGRISRAMI